MGHDDPRWQMHVILPARVNDIISARNQGCNFGLPCKQSLALQILRQFGELPADMVERQQYAAWKAADIRKALREGRSPTPGPPVKDDDLDLPDIPGQSLAAPAESKCNAVSRTEMEVLWLPGIVRHTLQAVPVLFLWVSRSQV